MFPAVSVIIPVYNQDRFIAQAIDSVLEQTFSDYEIIVVNDGSTDGTAEVLARYSDRIRLVNQRNAGLATARNRGLAIAQGKLVGFLDSDDLWYPEMLATTAAHLQANPDKDLVCGGWDIIDESGQRIKGPTKPSHLQREVDCDFLRTIVLGNLFPVHSLLIRRRCFDCCGVFDPHLQAQEDWDLWLRMAAHGHKVDILDTHLAGYRRHSGCMTLEIQRMEESAHRVLAKLFANESVAARLADLQAHAYTARWLSLAEYAQEAGLDKDLRRCVSMAEAFYQEAPFNEELNRRCFAIASRLAGTDRFMEKVSKTMPELLGFHYWNAARISLQQGRYLNAGKSSLKLAASRPVWLIRKILQKARRAD